MVAKGEEREEGRKREREAKLCSCFFPLHLTFFYLRCRGREMERNGEKPLPLPPFFSLSSKKLFALHLFEVDKRRRNEWKQSSILDIK